MLNTFSYNCWPFVYHQYYGADDNSYKIRPFNTVAEQHPESSSVETVMSILLYTLRHDLGLCFHQTEFPIETPNASEAHGRGCVFSVSP